MGGNKMNRRTLLATGTGGAIGGILAPATLSAAATRLDRSIIPHRPLSPAMGIEVIRQKAHRDCYDNQVKACGVKLVDVETLDDVDRAVNDRTALMLAYNFREGAGQIRHADW